MPEPTHGHGTAAEQGARIRAQMASRMNADAVRRQSAAFSSTSTVGGGDKKRRSSRHGSKRNSLSERQTVDANGWGQTREEAERQRTRQEQERIKRRYEQKQAAQRAERDQEEKRRIAKERELRRKRLAEKEAAAEKEEPDGKQTRRQHASRSSRLAAAGAPSERRKAREEQSEEEDDDEDSDDDEEEQVATRTSRVSRDARTSRRRVADKSEDEENSAEESEAAIPEEEEPETDREDTEEETSRAAKILPAAGGAALAAGGSAAAAGARPDNDEKASDKGNGASASGKKAGLFGFFSRKDSSKGTEQPAKDVKQEPAAAKKSGKTARTNRLRKNKEVAGASEAKSRTSVSNRNDEEESQVAPASADEVHDEEDTAEDEDGASSQHERDTENHTGKGSAAAAAAAGAGVGAGAFAAGAASRRVPESSEQWEEEPHPRKLLSKGRCFPMDGIDNLALLMEGDSYQTTCFSMYLFKTELDSSTLHRFFNKLVEWYPKFCYTAELDPSDASAKERALKKGKDVNRSSGKTARDGRRTKYSKTLKAGSAFSPAQWRVCEEFRASENILEVDGGCPRGKDEQALFAFAGDFLSEHFDYTKPLWSALCVRGLETSEGAKSALMIKVHHALSDGQGMIMAYHTALAALAEDAPINVVQDHVDTRTRRGEQKKPGQRNIHPTLWGTTKHGFHTLRGLYFRSRKAFEYGPVSLEDVDEEGRRGNDRAAKRFYCHSKGIPMSDITLVRDAFSDSGLNLSLNDVACAVLSRALRVAAERTETKRVRDKRVAIFVPISKRPPGNWEMANFTTGAIAWFAFNDPKKVSYKDQLAQVNREMNRIKRSHWPAIWFSLFGAVSKRRALFMPNYPIARQFFERTYREYHVATNLPGPSKPVKFGEHEAFSYHVLPPSSPGKSSLSIGMISYANDFSLAVSCDGVREFATRHLAQTICDAFQDAAQELVEAAQEERSRQSPRRIGATSSEEKGGKSGALSEKARRRVFKKKEEDARAASSGPALSEKNAESTEEASPTGAE